MIKILFALAAPVIVIVCLTVASILQNHDPADGASSKNGRKTVGTPSGSDDDIGRCDHWVHEFRPEHFDWELFPHDDRRY